MCLCLLPPSFFLGVHCTLLSPPLSAKVSTRRWGQRTIEEEEKPVALQHTQVVLFSVAVCSTTNIYMFVGKEKEWHSTSWIESVCHSLLYVCVLIDILAKWALFVRICCIKGFYIIARAPGVYISLSSYGQLVHVKFLPFFISRRQKSML